MALATPTPAPAWERAVIEAMRAVIEGAATAAKKAAAAAKTASTLRKAAGETANWAKILREAAEKDKTSASAAKAVKAEAEAAKAEAEAAKAEAEAARLHEEAARANKTVNEGNAQDEGKSPVKEILKEAPHATHPAKKAAEVIPKTNAGNQLPALVGYLIAIPAIMLGAILFLGGIILLLEPRYKNEEERLARRNTFAG